MRLAAVLSLSSHLGIALFVRSLLGPLQRPDVGEVRCWSSLALIANVEHGAVLGFIVMLIGRRTRR